MTNLSNHKVVTIEDLKGYLVPVSRKFKKGSLFSLRPGIDDELNANFVVDWLERTIYVTVKHGHGISFAEHRGEEWSVSVHRCTIFSRDADYVPSKAERHEKALYLARSAQDFLRNADSNGDLTEETKNTIKCALHPELFVVGERDPYGNLYMDHMQCSETTRVQNEVVKKICNAQSSASV